MCLSATLAIYDLAITQLFDYAKPTYVHFTNLCSTNIIFCTIRKRKVRAFLRYILYLDILNSKDAFNQTRYQEGTRLE